MTSVLVIGSSGQLGSELVTVLQESGRYQVVPLAHSDIEIADLIATRAALAPLRPDVVVNCAAFVRVDDAEDRVDEAFRVNAFGALHVARVCAEVNALCVYLSTDYVFDGQKGTPYTENDSPRPVNVYGVSKMAGEFLVQQSCPRWLIVRTAGLFGVHGARGKGGNFVETVIARARAHVPMRVVDDVRSSPSYARDVATGLERLLQRDTMGIVHLVNTGACTWFEFARAIVEYIGVQAEPQAVSSKEYGSRARRPRESALTSVRGPVFGVNGLRPWQDALWAYLIDAGHVAVGESAPPRSPSSRRSDPVPQ